MVPYVSNHYLPHLTSPCTHTHTLGGKEKGKRKKRWPTPIYSDLIECTHRAFSLLCLFVNLQQPFVSLVNPVLIRTTASQLNFICPYYETPYTVSLFLSKSYFHTLSHPHTYLIINIFCKTCPEKDILIMTPKKKKIHCLIPVPNHLPISFVKPVLTRTTALCAYSLH